MPLLSTPAGPLPAGEAADAPVDPEPDEDAADGAAAKQPTSGLSFANITKLGYAATGTLWALFVTQTRHSSEPVLTIIRF